MNTRWTPTRLLASCALLLALFGLCACSSLNLARKPDLTGTWQNRHGSTWTLREDGTFEMRHGAVFVLTGTYSLGNWSNRDKITLQYMGGNIPRDGHDPAVYRVKLRKQSARFVIVHDSCAIRMAALSTKWKRTNP